LNYKETKMTPEIEGLGESGTPIVSPYEDPIAIQVTRNTAPDIEYRLCEYDPVEQLSCRRTLTIRALEAEYDAFVSPEMYWGHWDLFCQHDGNSYYYKGLITTTVARDQEVIADDQPNDALLSHVDVVNTHLGRNYHVALTEDYIKNLFSNPPAGFPTPTLDTPQFYQCIDLGTSVVSIDDMDAGMLLKIKNTFTDDINPLLTNVSDRLHQVGDSIYCSAYQAFETNASNKLGVMMIATKTTKYISGNAYFFPFETLTTEQETFVTSLALIELDLQGEVVIVNL
jgi:hypothetical protein